MLTLNESLVIFEALSKVRNAYNSVAYKEQLEYVYTTNKKVADRVAIIDRVYKDISIAIIEVEENTGDFITLAKNALFLSKKNDIIAIEFTDFNCAAELFLNTEAMSEYKIDIRDVSEDQQGEGEVVVHILL